MLDSLLKCHNELLDIRKYLIKKGQSRYKGNVINLKLSEAKLIYEQCMQIFSSLESSKTLVSTTLNISEDIRKVYQEINNLCSGTAEIKSSTMEFDLKLACSLIPVMDGVEETTKRMIDTTEMYADMIDEKGYFDYFCT